METVEIVIKVQKELYEAIKAKNLFVFGMQNVKGLLQDAYLTIAKGIPLPKGHGRLIDADDLTVDYTSSDWNDYVSAEQIKNAEVLIEADKEGADE